jgi:hypothetical protein
LLEVGRVDPPSEPELERPARPLQAALQSKTAARTGVGYGSLLRAAGGQQAGLSESGRGLPQSKKLAQVRKG